MKAVALPPQWIDMKRIFASSRQVLANIALITAGSIIYTIGMNSILVPQGFLSGGVVGLSILFHYIVPAANIGLVYLLLNIPMIILGWFNISRQFMVYSLFGMIIFSLTAAVIKPTPVTISDPILAALFAGVVCGLGGGIILRSLGSAGGLDILTVYLNRKFGFRIGTIYYSGNAVILIIGAYIYDIQMVLYSIVFLFTCGKVIDAVLTGFNKRKSLMIISDHADEIAEMILSRQGRGVTFLRGEGAFSKKEKKVIFTITSLIELAKMKESIRVIDPEAFMVVNDTLEVLGTRHGAGRVF